MLIQEGQVPETNKNNMQAVEGLSKFVASNND